MINVVILVKVKIINVIANYISSFQKERKVRFIDLFLENIYLLINIHFIIVNLLFLIIY
jgi:hypothetical protein